MKNRYEREGSRAQSGRRAALVIPTVSANYAQPPKWGVDRQAVSLSQGPPSFNGQRIVHGDNAVYALDNATRIMTAQAAVRAFFMCNLHINQLFPFQQRADDASIPRPAILPRDHHHPWKRKNIVRLRDEVNSARWKIPAHGSSARSESRCSARPSNPTIGARPILRGRSPRSIERLAATRQSRQRSAPSGCPSSADSYPAGLAGAGGGPPSSSSSSPPPRDGSDTTAAPTGSIRRWRGTL